MWTFPRFDDDRGRKRKRATKLRGVDARGVFCECLRKRRRNAMSKDNLGDLIDPHFPSKALISLS